MKVRQIKPVRSIAIFLIIFIAALCGEGFNVSADELSPGGSISGKTTVAVSHSLISFVHTGIREDSSENAYRGQPLGRVSVSGDALGSMARRLLAYDGEHIPFGSRIHFRLYYLFICISGCVYLFSPALVRFIHLKDGSK